MSALSFYLGFKGVCEVNLLYFIGLAILVAMQYDPGPGVLMLSYYE